MALRPDTDSPGRTGNEPRAMVILRKTVIGLLRRL